MLIKTRGIIFRAIKYGETSFIADIYTEEKGLRTYIISGVRRQKSTVSAGLLQVMSLVDMVAYHREEKEMNRIKEIKAAHIYTTLPFEVTRSAVGMFMIELARKTIKETEENALLFQFLFDTFQYLDATTASVANLHLKFMLELSAYAGFWPSGLFSAQSPVFDLKEGTFLPTPPDHIHFMTEEFSELMSQILHSERVDCQQISMTREQRKQLLRALLDFYRHHIENFSTMNTYAILEEVLG